MANHDTFSRVDLSHRPEPKRCVSCNELVDPVEIEGKWHPVTLCDVCDKTFEASSLLDTNHFLKAKSVDELLLRSGFEVGHIEDEAEARASAVPLEIPEAFLSLTPGDSRSYCHISGVGGSGKTTMAVAWSRKVLTELLARDFTPTLRYVHEVEMLDAMQWSGGSRTEPSEFIDPDILIIDEAGGQSHPTDRMVQDFFRVIKKRIDRRAMTLTLSQFSFLELLAESPKLYQETLATSLLKRAQKIFVELPPINHRLRGLK